MPWSVPSADERAQIDPPSLTASTHRPSAVASSWTTRTASSTGSLVPVAGSTMARAVATSWGQEAPSGTVSVETSSRPSAR